MGRGTDSPSSEHLSREAIISELVDYISNNFDPYAARLCELIKRDHRDFAIGEKVKLIYGYGNMELGRVAKIVDIGPDDLLTVRFDNEEKPAKIGGAMFDKLD